MPARATEGTCLAKLVQLAVPLCQAAQRHCPWKGPGRPPDYQDWQIAILIFCAVLKKRKSKSAQYRFLQAHQDLFMRRLDLDRFPVRSTYFERYRHAHRLFKAAIALQAQQAIQRGLVDARVVAVDKSLLTARGPRWNRADRRARRVPPRLRGVDRDSQWGYSTHHGWVQGYSYEVVVAAPKKGPVWPLLASADTANLSEHISWAQKIDVLPSAVRYVLADGGYDKNEHAERVELDAQGRRTGRRCICPPGPMARANPPSGYRLTRREQWSRRQRLRRAQYFYSPRGQRLYARRGRMIEPFHDWFKELFDLDQRVWHRGLANNRTQLLAALYAYQVMLLYNHRCGHHNGQLQWIMDAL